MLHSSGSSATLRDSTGSFGSQRFDRLSLAEEDIKSGLLQRKKKDKWSIYFFVLVGRNLLIWDDEKRRYGGKKPKDSIALPDAKIEELPIGTFAEAPHAFSITEAGGTSHTVAAPNAAELANWLDVVRTAAAGGGISRTSVAIIEDLRKSQYEIPPGDLVIDAGSTLGTGASGVVRRGTWLRTEVAVKALRNLPEYIDTREMTQFYAEIEILSRLRHNNIVQMFGFCRKDNMICLVTEFVQGGNLADCLDEPDNYPLDLPLMTKLAMSITRGMIYLHNQKIIHHDLKPANILIESWEEARVKVCDFGLSKGAHSLGDSESLGSPQYAAPELATEEHDEKVDIFSFAVILWQIYHRRVPWDDELQFGSQWADRYAKQERPRVPPGCPFRDVISAGWASSPAQRPSFVQIFDSLADLLQKTLGLGPLDSSSGGISRTRSQIGSSASLSPRSLPSRSPSTVAAAPIAALSADPPAGPMLSPRDGAVRGVSTAVKDVVSAVLRLPETVRTRPDDLASTIGSVNAAMVQLVSSVKTVANGIDDAGRRAPLLDAVKIAHADIKEAIELSMEAASAGATDVSALNALSQRVKSLVASLSRVVTAAGSISDAAASVEGVRPVSPRPALQTEPQQQAAPPPRLPGVTLSGAAADAFWGTGPTTLPASPQRSPVRLGTTLRPSASTPSASTLAAPHTPAASGRSASFSPAAYTLASPPASPAAPPPASMHRRRSSISPDHFPATPDSPRTSAASGGLAGSGAAGGLAGSGGPAVSGGSAASRSAPGSPAAAPAPTAATSPRPPTVRAVGVVEKLCGGCGQAIIGGRSYKAVGDKVFHNECFVCRTCRAPLTSCYAYEGEYYCDTHYNEIAVAAGLLSACATCGKVLSGSYMEHGGKSYHADCFVCDMCGQPMTQFVSRGGKNYCGTCRHRLT